jgi:hypothetical protein
MPLKEQLVYLRFWLGIMVVTEITLVGWLSSTPNTANPVLWSLAAVGTVLPWLRYLPFASSGRAPHRRDQEVIAMELLAGVIMLAVVLLFVGIALDAARRK